MRQGFRQFPTIMSQPHVDCPVAVLTHNPKSREYGFSFSIIVLPLLMTIERRCNLRASLTALASAFKLTIPNGPPERLRTE
jgi:hypothetical protein